MDGEGTVERAFELARSGQYRTVNDIRAQLRKEGHSDVQQHLGGKLIRTQLRAIISGATAN